MSEEKITFEEMLNTQEQDDETLVCNSLGKEAHWAINKVLVETLGLGRAAILTKLIDWHNFIHRIMDEKNRTSSAEYYGGIAPKLIAEKFFYLSIEDLSKEFGLGEVFCRQTIDMFAYLGIITKKKAGLPARNFCKLNFRNIRQILSCKSQVSLIAVLNKFDESVKLARQNDQTSPMNLSKIIKTKQVKTKEVKTEDFSFSKEKEMDGEAVMVQSSKKKSWRKDETQPTTHPSKELNNISSFEKKRESLRGKHTSSAGDLDAYDIINKWESLGFPKIPSEHRSSTLKKIDSLIAGTFFEGKLLHNGSGKYLNRPFTKTEILKAIENRARGAFDPEYVPTDQKIKRDLQKLPLTVWFYNSNAGDSRFLYDFEKKYKKIPAKLKLIPDEFPEYTESIIDTYVDKILYGVVPKEWPIKDQNNFRKASQRLREYFIDNEDRSRYIKPHQIDEQADVLIRALRNHYGNDDDDENVSIHSANLCSDYTFNKILPSYMGKQRMLNRTTDFY